jgi:hypothetical protein
MNSAKGCKIEIPPLKARTFALKPFFYGGSQGPDDFRLVDIQSDPHLPGCADDDLPQK